MRLLSLRPGNLLITHKVTLLIDFSNSVTLLAAIQATGLLAFTLTGLTPAEHTSLSWTYKLVRNFTSLAIPVCMSLKFVLIADYKSK